MPDAISTTENKNKVLKFVLFPLIICAVYAFLCLYGISTGLPSDERLNVSLGGISSVEKNREKISQLISSGIAERSEFIQKEDKPQMALLSPYLDMLRTYHPDEQYILKVIARMVREKDINPGSYIYGPFFFYQVGAGLCAGKILGLIPSGQDALYYMEHPSEFAPVYLNARLVCAFFGIMTLIVTYLTGMKIGGLRIAVTASGILALMPLMNMAGKFIKPDTPAAFWTVAALFFAVSAISRAKWSDYILSGICTGLAAGSKYPAVLAGSFILVYHIIRRVKEKKGIICPEDLMLITAGLASLMSFIITNPAFLVHNGIFMQDVKWISGVLREGSFLNNLWDSAVCYTQDAFLFDIGPAASIAIVAGLFVILKKPSAEFAGMLPAIAAFMFFACRGRPGSDAYMLPVYPALALIGAKAFESISNRYLRYGLFAALAVVTFSYSLAYSRVAAAENVRLSAARWFNEHAPAGASVASLQYPVGYRVPMVSPERYILKSSDFDKDALKCDYYFDSSFEWKYSNWQDRFAGRTVENPPPSSDYEVIIRMENVPRALFGLLPLKRKNMLSPYIETIAPCIVIYKRKGI